MRSPFFMLVAMVWAGPALAQAPAVPRSAAPPAAPPVRHIHTPLIKPPRNMSSAKVPPAVAPPQPVAAAAGQPGPLPPSSPPALPLDPAKGAATGLPLPRWASLRTDEVNLRTGPGTRYPIDWVYKRRDLPVQITREFEQWRLIVDQDDTKGWVHQATLVGRRDFVVVGAERVLRDAARDDAAAVARLAVGVVGRIRACAASAAWCEVQVGEYRGWLPRAAFWGTAPGEAVQ